MPVLESLLVSQDEAQEEISLDDEHKFPLRKSLFSTVPPTIRFFSAEDEKDIIPLPAKVRNQLKWKLTNITPTLVRETLRRSGYKMTRDDRKWVGMWGKHMKTAFYCAMNEYQKVNHFPGSFHLGRKDKLHINLSRLRRNSALDLDFVPQTFLLPVENKTFHQAWKKEGTVHRWIAKPPASSRGTGVFIVSRWSQISQKLNEPLVVQKYIHKPLLINGNKFDLRLYALVTCWDPLKVYVYKQGMVRFATMPYSESADSLSNTFMHLTNYSLNKMSSQYTDKQKWTLDELWDYFQKHHPKSNVSDIWGSLVDVIVKTIAAAEAPITRLSQMHSPSRYSCFELFGFDILLDSELKPWLLEVNISPSMRASSENDTVIKEPLVRDLLNVIGLHLPFIENGHFDPTDYGLDEHDVLFMSPSFHRNLLTAAELHKRNIFTCEHLELREDAIIENLLPADAMMLVHFEDETERARESNFVRVIPSVEYEDIIPQRYWNKLLMAWEKRYAENREKGRAILQDLCRNRAHLLPSDTVGKEVTAVVDKKRNTQQWKSSSGVRLASAGKIHIPKKTVYSTQRRRNVTRSDSSDSLVSLDSYQDDNNHLDQEVRLSELNVDVGSQQENSKGETSHQKSRLL